MSASKVEDSIEEGQRIYVTGVITYSPFERAEGPPKLAGQIHSTNIFICEKNDDPSSGNRIHPGCFNWTSLEIIAR